MGRLFDPKYFQSAISVYKFLMKQYPGSHYRGEALFHHRDKFRKTISRSRMRPTASFQEYLKRFPHSERSADARAALKEIAVEKPHPLPGRLPPHWPQ